MGSGKTTLGPRLSEALGFSFFELDKAIEFQVGITIAEIFESKRESYFRQIEQKVLRQTILLNETVIACGGGTPCFFDNMEWMNKNGFTIFLDTEEKILKERLSNDRSDRPLLKNKTELELAEWISQTLKIRRPFYEKAAMFFCENDALKLADKISSNQLSF